MNNLVNHATDEMKDFVDQRAQDAEIPSEEQEVFDDSWIDDLEVDENFRQPVQQPQQPQPVQAPPVDTSEAAQKERLDKLLGNMEHVDREVAEELYNKVVAPVASRLEAEVGELRRTREEEIEAKRTATLQRVNAEIQKRYPKSQKILRSAEFMRFVNSTTSPYASETNFDILTKAYYAGDAEYVLDWVDRFVDSRGKPKPPVGVEVSKSGGGSPDSTGRKRQMTDEEYRRKRLQIRHAPPGTYPPGALSKLVEEYLKGRA